MNRRTFITRIAQTSAVVVAAPLLPAVVDDFVVPTTPASLWDFNAPPNPWFYGNYADTVVRPSFVKCIYRVNGELVERLTDVKFPVGYPLRIEPVLIDADQPPV